jgi:hypothetical protein
MKAWLLVLLSFVVSAASPAGAQSQDPRDDRVPLVALLANPALYDGRHVETFGYLNLVLEGDALYASKNDFEAYATQNGIWFDGPKQDVRARRVLDRHYVEASGVFHAVRRGSWYGVLTADEVQIAPSRRQLSYLYELNLSPIPLPWPPILGLLLLATTLIYGGHLIHRIMARESTPQQRGFAHAILGQPAPWLFLVLITTLLIVLRVIGTAEVVRGAPYLDRSDIWFVFGVAECLAGVCGLAAMWAAHVTRRRTLCALAIVLQLIVPGTRELMRMDTWESQMTYPFRTHSVSESWSRHPTVQQPR